jgi:hypothetical protein
MLPLEASYERCDAFCIIGEPGVRVCRQDVHVQLILSDIYADEYFSYHV